MPADNKTTKGQDQQQETPKMGDANIPDTTNKQQDDDLTAPIVGNQHQQVDENEEPVEDNADLEDDEFETDDNIDDIDEEGDDMEEEDADEADDIAETEEDDDDETK